MKKTLLLILLVFIEFTFAQEMNLVELKKINYSGNISFSDADLGDVVGIKESPAALWQTFGSLFGTGEEAVYFDSLALNDEVLRIKSFYFNNGFFNSKISYRYKVDFVEKEAEVTFFINEGDPSRYKEVKIFGLDSLKGALKSNVKWAAKLDTSKVYSYEYLSSINQNVLMLLKNNGYMFADIDSTLISIDTTNNFVNSTLYFHLGKKYKIADIEIVKSGDGKDEVDSNLITEIVGIDKNDTYSIYDIQRGKNRLYKTKIFNVAAINSEIKDTVGNKVPLKISTEIGKMYQATPEVIMNNEDDRFNLGLGIGFSKKNFFGDARILTLNASIAAQNIFEFVQNISVSNTEVIGYADLRLIMEQPFLLGKNIDTRYEVYSTIQKRQNEYNTIVRGFKVGLNFELPPYVYLSSFGVSWDVENLQVLYQEEYLHGIFVRVFNQATYLDSVQVDSVASILTNSIAKTTKSDNTLLSLNFAVNKTNDFVFPTEGYKANLILANANFAQYVMSKIYNYNLISPLYYKAQLDFSIFPSIYHSKLNAFGIKLRAGNIFVYEGIETTVPYNQRFTSGGSNSVRGWQSRELVPPFSFGNIDFNSLSPTDLEAIFLDQAAPGGLFQFEGTIETRNRLIGNVGTAIFIDYGNTWDNASNFRFDEIAVSAGIGFRYYTDFIPIRIDFAVKLYDPNSSKLISERSFWNDLLQIHFAIGEAF